VPLCERGEEDVEARGVRLNRRSRVFKTLAYTEASNIHANGSIPGEACRQTQTDRRQSPKISPNPATSDCKIACVYLHADRQPFAHMRAWVEERRTCTQIEGQMERDRGRRRLKTGRQRNTKTAVARMLNCHSARALSIAQTPAAGLSLPLDIPWSATATLMPDLLKLSGVRV